MSLNLRTVTRLKFIFESMVAGSKIMKRKAANEAEKGSDLADVVQSQ
jgi:hypothetical protein